MYRAVVAALVFLLLFVTGCAPMVTSVQSLQLTGSGKITDQDFTFDKADRLMVGSNFKATFAVGDKVGVAVHADDNVMQYVYVHVSNGELRLEMKPGQGYSMNKVTLRADVTMPVPSAITLDGNAALDLGTGLKAGEMTVKTGGNTLLTGEQLSVARLNLTSEGNAIEKLGGAVAELAVDGSGNTKLVGPILQIHTAKIHLRDNGTAEVYVTDKLDYNVSGNAGIVYTGTPKLGEQTRSGNANVTQK